MSRFRTALIGAGYISNAHLDALKSGAPEAEIVAIVDRNRAAADTRAKSWGIPNVYSDVNELIAAGVADVAHVLAPPDAHAGLARTLLEGGLNVFLEKPMAVSAEDCDGLNALAADTGRVLGVNQNFVFHPTYRKARRILLDENRLGPIRSIHAHFSVPLRQLGARQFGHWMFQKPVNILLEQAVHPLSQLADLLGAPTRIAGRAEAPLQLAPGQIFHDRWSADLGFGDIPCQALSGFRAKLACLAMDRDLRRWAADLRYVGRPGDRPRAAQWPEFLDHFVTGLGVAGSIAGESAMGALGYLTGLLKLTPNRDGFAVSMRDSVAAFYRGLAQGKAPLDGRFGGELVRICQTLAAGLQDRPRPRRPHVARNPQRPIQSWWYSAAPALSEPI